MITNLSSFSSDTNFDCDIVYSNGVFLSYPDGLSFN